MVEEDIAENYSPEVVQLTCMGTYRGHEGVRQGNRILEEPLYKVAKAKAGNKLYKVLLLGLAVCRCSRPSPAPRNLTIIIQPSGLGPFLSKGTIGHATTS